MSCLHLAGQAVENVLPAVDKGGKRTRVSLSHD